MKMGLVSTAPRTTLLSCFGAARLIAGALLFCLVLSGCLSVQKITAPFRRDPCFTHTVTWPGESLYLIAAWYTGNGDNWKRIARGNPELNPDRIRVGEVIRIPEHLIQTRKPLPQAFVQSRGEKHAGHISSKPPEETPGLFGPKPYPSQ